jgi:hypothetical protein
MRVMNVLPLLLIAGFACADVKITEPDIKKLLGGAYACGMVDGAMKVYVAQGNDSGVALTRKLATESGCDLMRDMVGSKRP